MLGARSQFRAWAALSALLVLPGCYDWRSGVASTAAQLHSCPAGQVQVLGDNGNGYARIVNLNVCGQPRVFQDLGGRNGYAWVDVTTTAGGAEAARHVPGPSTAEAPPTTTGPFDAQVRARIDVVRGQILACTGTASAAVEAAWVPDGPVEVRLRDSEDALVLDCVSQAIGTLRAPGSASVGHILHGVSGN